MAVANVNGQDVVSARVTLPRVGRWVAVVEVVADSIEGLLGPVTLDLGAIKLSGYAARGGDYAETVTLLIQGGRAGAMKVVEPRAWTEATVAVVLRSLAQDAGETLAASCDPAVLTLPLPRWLRRQRLVWAELESVRRAAQGAGPDEVAWRFLADGSLWMGREGWPVVELDHDLLDVQPTLNEAVIGVELPSLLPGTTFLGRRVEMVEYLVDARQVRTKVTWQDQSPTGELNPSVEAERLKLLISRMVDPTRLLEVHPAEVVAQNIDGTLELKVDDPTMPGLSKVPMRAPWPGLTFKVAPGSRVQVLCPAGDPGAQVSALWEPAAGSTLELVSTATTSTRLEASAILLGTQAGAVHPLLKGDVQQAADQAFDQALVAASTAFATAAAPIAAGLTAVLAAAAVAPVSSSPVLHAELIATPAGGAGIGTLLQSLVASLGIFTAAVQAAATARDVALTPVLSAVSKTE